MSLATYRKKRNFTRTPEPQGEGPSASTPGLRFVVQKHAASRLHYDFRLELDGVLKSWAVPKGPSLDPSERTLAVEVEDHPLEYGTFEGTIPKGEYGGGTVMVWDRGVWTPEGDAKKSYQKGKLKFHLEGEKLTGDWTLIRMGGKAAEEGKNWLLLKSRDQAARPGDGHGIVERLPNSVATERSLEEIASANGVATNGRTAKRGSRNKQRAKTPPAKIPVARLTGAVKRPLPKKFKPQLATLTAEIPEGDGWLHEVKYDGYRLLAFCDQKVRLMTRGEQDWTARFPGIAKALEKLALRGTLLDGEAVVLDSHGVSDFQALQNVLNNGRQQGVVFYVFDAPYLDGYDLSRTPQIERTEALRAFFAQHPESGPVRFSDHIRGQGEQVAQHACAHHLEGVICKRADAPYSQRRSPNWLKVKCLKRQELVIGGWTPPGGARKVLGALLLGYYQQGKLVYAGRVGTGFNSESLELLGEQLAPLKTKECPFDEIPKAAKRDAHWVDPELVAEVEFTEWTGDHVLRHPSFKGLREDKRPQDIVRETNDPPVVEVPDVKPSPRGTADTTILGVRISSPDRVVYAEQGVTKLELAQYYADVADKMLPYVAGRPLTVVRCPGGRGKQCFYQKHATGSLPPEVGQVEVEEGDGPAHYITIDKPAGLVALVQMGAMEFHPWGSRNDQLQKPDLLVFDLDPDPAAAWKQVVDGAFELRERLEELGLESFLRTTGGKGLHVVVPLTRRTTWDQAKPFARALAEAMVHDSPEAYVATASKAKRKGRVFVDYLRNDHGSTAIANYSTRSRAGAPVAMPLAWGELNEELRPDQFHVGNVRERLAKLRSDPWRGFFKLRQSLTKRMLKEYGGGG